MNEYICPICNNKDPIYIGYKNGVPYCRRCITFQGNDAKPLFRSDHNSNYYINYSLSKEQELIANKICYNFLHGYDTLVNAVCGAGKTEIIYNVIRMALRMNMNVAFVIPRRDVVIELYNRLKWAFRKNKVIAVYGEHTSELVGDLVVMTTHQLYRYEKYFDLMILDEIDAFPFRDNFVLDSLFKRAVKGHYVMMSATPSDKVIEEFQGENKRILELNVRFHKRPIPVPEIQIVFFKMKILKLASLLKQFISERKQTFIFTPTIAICEEVYKALSYLVKGGEFVHSKRANRPQIIDNFRKREYFYLVTTAVLERGVTIENLQVVIYDADNNIYDKAALVQISGRVGRKKKAPDGRVIFLANKITKPMREAIDEIKYKNESVQSLFQTH